MFDRMRIERHTVCSNDSHSRHRWNCVGYDQPVYRLQGRCEPLDCVQREIFLNFTVKRIVFAAQTNRQLMNFMLTRLSESALIL